MSTYCKPLGNLSPVSAECSLFLLERRVQNRVGRPFLCHTIAGRDSFLKQLCFDGVIEDMEDG